MCPIPLPRVSPVEFPCGIVHTSHWLGNTTLYYWLPSLPCLSSLLRYQFRGITYHINLEFLPRGFLLGEPKLIRVFKLPWQYQTKSEPLQFCGNFTHEKKLQPWNAQWRKGPDGFKPSLRMGGPDHGHRYTLQSCPKPRTLAGLLSFCPLWTLSIINALGPNLLRFIAKLSLLLESFLICWSGFRLFNLVNTAI